MQEEIVKLLNQTLSNDDQIIHNAEKILSELSVNQDFLPALLGIILTPNFPEITRLSALIHMRIVIERYWSTHIEDRVKEMIRSSIIQLIITWPAHLMQNVRHYMRSVISASFQNGEWIDLPSIIFQQLSQGSEESCMIGLILADSLCGVIKGIDKSNQAVYPIINEFGNTFLSVLFDLFSQCQKLEFLSLGFHCASRILLSNVIIKSNDFTNKIGIMIEKSLQIVNVQEGNEYLNFAKNALKFSIQFINKFASIIPDQFIVGYLQVIQNLLPQNVANILKVLLLRLLYEIFKCPNTWPMFENGLVNFLANLMMPLFALTQDNLEALKSNNPEEFVNDVHKTDNQFEDVRLSASSVIYSLHEHIELVEAARIVAATTFTNYMTIPNITIENQVVLFASFHMFSSVSKFLKDIDPLIYQKFFEAIAPLYDAQDQPLARSAAFMLLSKSINVPAPESLILKCIDHIADPFPLVSYYASVAAAGLIENAKDIDSVKQHFLNSPIVPILFQSLFNLSKTFRMPDIADAVTSLIKIFNVQLLPIISDVCHGLVQFLAESCDTIEMAQSIICDSLEFLVDLIASSQETKKQIAPQLCTEAFNVLSTIEQPEIFDLLASTTIRLFEMATFSPSMWAAAHLLIERIKNDPEVSITDLVTIITLFVFKDTDFAIREDMPLIVEFCVDQMNQRMNDFDTWNEFAKLASNILLRLTISHPITQNIFQPSIEMSLKQLNENLMYHPSISGLVMLINSLLLTNIQSVSQILGSYFNTFIGFWAEKVIFPETVQTFLTCINFFLQDHQLFMSALLNISENIFDDLMMRDEDDDFDEKAEYESSCLWFDFKGTLLKFYSFLQSFNQINATLYQHYIEQIPTEWQEKIGMIPSFAERYVSNQD